MNNINKTEKEGSQMVTIINHLKLSHSRNTVEFSGVWGRLNNPKFKPFEFDGFKNQTGYNSFSFKKLLK